MIGKSGLRFSLLHRAFRRITLIINQQMYYIKFHIKTLKIAPTCFDPMIILRNASGYGVRRVLRSVGNTRRTP